MQQYVDHDPGPNSADYQCGSQTYDGHDGTDFRVPTLRAMENGVAVLAAADGVVARIRDGVADRTFDSRSSDVSGRECGNGVVVEHAEDWTTVYCHLKQGSIAVRSGDPVRAGDRLAEVGLSGQTEFPHLEFIVRRGENVVDPFRPEDLNDPPNCTPASAPPLWRTEFAEALRYRDPYVLNVGFAAGRITMEDVESGLLEGKEFNADSPALVVFGRAIGIREGDQQRLTLTAPDGSVVLEELTDPADRPKAQLFAFAGERRPAEGWRRGTYLGRYAILRDGAEVASAEARVEID